MSQTGPSGREMESANSSISEYMSIISNTESSYISILELRFFSGEEHDSISTDKMVNDMIYEEELILEPTSGILLRKI